MRGVRSELQLAATSGLDRLGDPAPDHHGTRKDGPEEERRDQERAEEHRSLHVRDDINGLGHDHPVRTDRRAGDADLGPVDRRGHR